MKIQRVFLYDLCEFKCWYVKSENGRGGGRRIFIILCTFIPEKEKLQNSTIFKTGCTVCDDGILAESTVSNWFARFSRGNVDLEYRKRTCRPAVIDVDQIETLIKNNTDNATRDIEENTPHILYERYKAFENIFDAIRF